MAEEVNVKAEEPDDFCSDKPVPKYWFGIARVLSRLGRQERSSACTGAHQRGGGTAWISEVRDLASGWGRIVCQKLLR